MADIAQLFVKDSRDFVTQVYLPRIERCVSRLTDEQIWSRANDASNSVGNLILHLAGSTRFWASDVIGQTPTGRIRQEEFDQRERIPPDQLLAILREAVSEADRRLGELRSEQLTETRAAKEWRPTVLWSVYHIVEHFAMHTGQILSMTKALVGDVRSESSP